MALLFTDTSILIFLFSLSLDLKLIPNSISMHMLRVYLYTAIDRVYAILHSNKKITIIKLKIINRSEILEVIKNTRPILKILFWLESCLVTKEFELYQPDQGFHILREAQT